LYVLNLAYPGVFTVTLNGTQDNGSGKEHFMVDGQRLVGTVSLPQNKAGNSSALTFSITTPGLHGIAVYVGGPQRISLNSLMITRLGSTPSLISLVISGVPALTTAGVAGSITVTAEDPDGNVAAGYLGTVHFTSSDAQAILPADYTFVASDNGTYTFSGLTLRTAGAQFLTVQDGSTTAAAVIGVIAAPANHFLVSAPANAVSGMAFDITITALDPFGNVDMNYAGTVTFSSSDADPGIMLPNNYGFQTSDSGTHSFPAAVVLITLGDQTLTATDTGSGIAGNATVAVEPSAPRRDRTEHQEWLFAWVNRKRGGSP
jgi:hypothetical protein